MNFTEYQADARRTLTINNDPLLLAIMGLGLTGEAGEVVEMIKKYLGHGHELDRIKLTKELGDTLWYLSAIATLCGIDMSIVAEVNINKLKVRYPQGFSHEASKSRVSP